MVVEREFDYDSVFKIVDDASNSVYVCNAQTYELIYMNKSACEIAHCSKAQYKGKRCYEFMMGVNAPCKFCKIGEMSKEKYTVREFRNPINNRNYDLKGKLIDVNGVTAHIEYITDITDNFVAKKFMQEKEQMAQEQYNRLVEIYNSMPCSIVRYTFSKKPILYFANSVALKNLGFKNVAAINEAQFEIGSFIHNNDLQKLYDAHNRLVSIGDRANIIFRSVSADNVIRWNHGRIELKISAAGHTAVEMICIDITSAKEYEYVIEKSRTITELINKKFEINTWEYDIVNNSYTIDIGNVVLVGNSFETYSEMVKKLKNGEANVYGDVECMLPDGSIKWYRIDYTTCFSEDEMPLTAIGISCAIVSNCQCEDNFKIEAFSECAISRSCFATYTFNLTKNNVETRYIKDEKYALGDGKSIDGVLDDLRERLCDATLSRKCTVDKKYFISQYKSGTNHIELKYSRSIDNGGIITVMLTINLFKHTNGRYIMAYLCAEDISNNELVSDAVRILAERYCQFVMCIEVATKTVTFLGDNRATYDYGDFLKDSISSKVAATRYNQAAKRMELENVIEKLKNAEMYECEYRLFSKNGIRDVMWEFSYLDKERTKIFAISKDVTKYKSQQVRQRIIAEHERLKSENYAILDKQDSNECTTINMAELLEDVKWSMSDEVSVYGIRVHTSVSGAFARCESTVDLKKLKWVLCTLLRRAVLRAHKVDTIELKAKSIGRRGNELVWNLSVENKNDHLYAEELKNFFVCTDDNIELPLAKDILKMLGGSIDVVSTKNAGTCVKCVVSTYVSISSAKSGNEPEIVVYTQDILEMDIIKRAAEKRNYKVICSIDAKQAQTNCTYIKKGIFLTDAGCFKSMTGGVLSKQKNIKTLVMYDQKCKTPGKLCADRVVKKTADYRNVFETIEKLMD